MKQFLIGLIAATCLIPMAQAQTLSEMGEVTKVEGTLTGNATNAANQVVAPQAAPSAAPAPGGYVPKIVAAPPPTAILPVTPSTQPRTGGQMDSLFFTSNELASIMRASQGYLAPKEAYDEKNQGDNPFDRGPRTITLSGIVYNGPHDWTLWLNGERISPKNIPERITALTVQHDKIHLKWFDIGNQRIVGLTLRPHQRYNLDDDTITPASW